MAITVDHAAVGAVLTQAEYEAASGAAHSVSGEVAQADQTALEAETNEDTYVPPDLLKHSPGVAKAWCRITTAGALESPDYNVASVTDVGTGDRTIVIDTDFSGIVYVGVSTLTGSTDSHHIEFRTFAVGSVKLHIADTTPAFVDHSTGQALFGDQ